MPLPYEHRKKPFIKEGESSAPDTKKQTERLIPKELNDELVPKELEPGLPRDLEEDSLSIRQQGEKEASNTRKKAGSLFRKL